MRQLPDGTWLFSDGKTILSEYWPWRSEVGAANRFMRQEDRDTLDTLESLMPAKRHPAGFDLTMGQWLREAREAGLLTPQEQHNLFSVLAYAWHRS